MLRLRPLVLAPSEPIPCDLVPETLQRPPSSQELIEPDVTRPSVEGLSVEPPISEVTTSWVPEVRRRGKPGQSLLDWVAGLIVSSAIATAFLLGADRAFRPDWDFLWSDHWAGSTLLVGAVAAWLGLAWSLVVLLELGLTYPLRRHSKRRRWVRALFHGALFGALVWGTARWTFEGKRISQTVFATIGPPLFVLLVMLIVTAFVWWVIGIERRCARGQYRQALLVGCCLILAAAVPIVVDMKLYVSLYEPLHGLLEGMAFALIFTGTQLVGFVVVRRWQTLLWVARALAAALVVYGVVFTVTPRLRDYVDRLLGHTWVDEIYVGRALRRTQVLEATLQGTDPKSLEIVRVQRLTERYELDDTSLHPLWDTPPAARAEALQAFRGTSPRNILVYYVDTLRYDVARDPELMPSLVRFAEESLDFRRAYSPGSDTLRSLPALTGGNYYVQHTHGNDLCNIAKRSPHESVLVIPQSAHEFLKHLRPAFDFETVLSVRDYAEERKVWGYGADQPTAGKLVDEALGYLEQREGDPFFMWLFNFDQHSWREMEESYVEEQAQAFGIPREGELNFRYRVIARAIDAEFGRLLRGLDRLGLSEDTVVVVVADHGEGLGRAGFWVHSVFLWESLIRVPLVIRVPGVEPQVIEDIVSLVDVAPTLAPFFGNADDLRGYQGIDLLSHAAGEPMPRKHPLVLRAANRDRLVRIGLLDPETGLKLVVRLEAALPELYDLDAEDPDAASLATQRPGMTRALLRRVATSPVFPRAASDFDLLVQRGTKEF